MRNGIVHHKSDRKSCVIPTSDRNNRPIDVKPTHGKGTVYENA